MKDNKTIFEDNNVLEQWIYENKIHPYVIAYIKKFISSGKFSKLNNNFPKQQLWEGVSRILIRNRELNKTFIAIQKIIGLKHTLKFNSFIQLECEYYENEEDDGEVIIENDIEALIEQGKQFFPGLSNDDIKVLFDLEEQPAKIEIEDDKKNK